MAHIDRDAKGDGSAKKLTTEERIYASVLRIAQREGFSATSIDAVVADSGVAKTTIYRRYADRKEMQRLLVFSVEQGIRNAYAMPMSDPFFSLEGKALDTEVYKECLKA